MVKLNKGTEFYTNRTYSKTMYAYDENIKT